MKYLVMTLLFAGCASKETKEIKVIPKVIKITKQTKLLNCVDRYLEKDIRIGDAFAVCKSIYERK